MTAWTSAWWWQHLPVLPVLLPAFTAMALLILGDHGGASSGHASAKLRWARRIGLVSVALGLGLAVLLVGQAADGATPGAQALRLERVRGPGP